MLSHEAILHYIWKFKLFSLVDLKTIDGEDVQILSAGIHNLDAGPDFLNTKLKIGETLWVGNVEIHLKSSDWIKHQHQTDKSYDNVILHVVWDADAEIFRTDGTLIPTLALKDRVDQNVVANYEELKQNNYWIPCEKQLNVVNDLTKQQCLDRMMMERLEDKSKLILQLHQNLKGSWEDTFYVTLAKSFGFKVNTLPFELLALNLPQIILAKHKNQALQIEALVFGVAGLLNQDFVDDYPKKLRSEFRFLKAKYKLNQLAPELWKFSKTRPDNFPTMRLAQFAALIIDSQHLFSKIIAIKELDNFSIFFNNLTLNPYWRNHFVFDKQVSKQSFFMGRKSVDVLLLNAIVPLLFFYGKQIGNPLYEEQAIKLLEFIKPEQNNIITGFIERGFKVSHAFDTQALIQLKKYYCDHKKCLNCAIGLKILRS